MKSIKRILVRLKQRIQIEFRMFTGQKNELPQRLITSNSLEFTKETDVSFEKVLKRYEIKFDSLLVVGANDGAELVHPAYSQFKTVFAVEPDPRLQKQLSANLSNFKLSKIFPIAVGETAARSQVYMSNNNGQSSSLLKPKLHLSVAPHVKFNDSYVTEVKRLDSLLEIFNCPKIWVVDVQGYELKVFKGAGNLLSCVDLIYCEVNRGEVYDGCAQIAELDEFLGKFDLHRVLVRWWGLWGDAIYSRRDIYARNEFI